MPRLTDEECEARLLEDVTLNWFNHFGIHQQSERRFVVIGLQTLTPGNYGNMNDRIVENYLDVVSLSKALPHSEVMQVLSYVQAYHAVRNNKTPPQKR